MGRCSWSGQRENRKMEKQNSNKKRVKEIIMALLPNKNTGSTQIHISITKDQPNAQVRETIHKTFSRIPREKLLKW